MLGHKLKNAKNRFSPLLGVIFEIFGAKIFFSEPTMFFTVFDYPICGIELGFVRNFFFREYNAIYEYFSTGPSLKTLRPKSLRNFKNVTIFGENLPEVG